MLITKEKLNGIIEYENGKMFWKVVPKHRGGSIKIGDEAGYLVYNVKDDRYRWKITISGKAYFRSRLVFIYFNGHFSSSIDHINRDTMDDRIENLRIANGNEQASNKRLYKNNSSGYKGVCLAKGGKKWVAQIQTKGKNRTIGYYDAPQDAHEAYCEEAKKLHGNFFCAR